MKQELRNCFIRLPNGFIVQRELTVNYKLNKPNFAYDGSGVTYYTDDKSLFRFALSFDEMVTKFVKSKKRKTLLKENKESYLSFSEVKEVGRKIWIPHESEKNTFLECTWNGEFFECGKHLFQTYDDLLNIDFHFHKPENKIILTEWTKVGFEWSDGLKCWIPKKISEDIL